MSRGSIEHDDRLVAGVDLIRRCGAREFQIRYDDAEEPVVWMATARFHTDEQGRPVPEGGEMRWEAAGAMAPLTAVMRLCEQLVDGGTCSHCWRTTAVDQDFAAMRPANDLLCWYVYDPELNTFRRSCEGTTKRRRP